MGFWRETKNNNNNNKNNKNLDENNTCSDGRSEQLIIKHNYIAPNPFKNAQKKNILINHKK